MNIIHKHRISFSSKALATVLLSVLLNVASVWGQTNEVVKVSSATTCNITTEMQCGNTYRLSASGSDNDHVFNLCNIDNLNEWNINTRTREFKFTSATGQIKIDSFVFVGVAEKRTLMTTYRPGTKNETIIETRSSTDIDWGDASVTRIVTTSDWQWEDFTKWITVKENEQLFDYLEVNGVRYGGDIDDYGNEYLYPIMKETDTCLPMITGESTAGWEISADELTRTMITTYNGREYKHHIKNITNYTRRFVIPAMVLYQNNVTFKFVEQTSRDTLIRGEYGYPPANFTVNVTPLLCCPTITSPVDDAVVISDITMLSWSSIPNATAYKVYYKMDNESSYTATDVLNSTSYQLTTSVAGKYRWYVVPIVNGEERQFCDDTYTFSRCITVPSCVNTNTMIPANNAVLGSRWFSWEPVECASLYDLYVAPMSAGITNLISETNRKATISETEILVPVLPEGEYNWVVVPKNGNGSAIGCTPQSFRVEYSAAENHVVSASTQGREFYFSLMENGFDSQNGQYKSDQDKYKAIISPKYNAEVTFYYFETDRSETFQVSAGQTKTVTLNRDEVYHPGVGDQYKRRTVRVTSTADISLYISNEANYSFDASIVLPLYTLGSEYRIQTYPNSWQLTSFQSDYPCFMIIGTKDSTFVQIAGPHSNEINPANPQGGLIMLNEGDSYFVKSASQSTSSSIKDLSGLTISVVPRAGHPEDTCKTVAVFNGNVITSVPNTLGNNYDHLVEQAFPISNWGKKFAITSSLGYTHSTLSSHPGVDYIRITSNEPNTQLTIKRDGVADTMITLATAGQTAEFKLKYSYGSCYIEATQPVACYLYQRSSSSSSQNADDQTGDPSMVWIAPIERGIEEITFSTFDFTVPKEKPLKNHYVNVVIPAEALENEGKVMLTSTGTSGNIDRDITAEFKTLSGNATYKYARVQINHGTYTLRSTAGGQMVIHVYGIGYARGYAYNAGCAAVPYKSAFRIGDNNSMSEISMFPSDYHFCTGSEYYFGINSNTAAIDSVIWTFEDGITEIVRPDQEGNIPNYPHTITTSGSYEISADIYSTVYDNANCQREVVVDHVSDYIFVFVSPEEIIKDTICQGESYTINYYNEDEEPVTTTLEYDYIQSSLERNERPVIEGYTRYGCKRNYILDLRIYGTPNPGSIRISTTRCPNGSFTITQLLNNQSAGMSGGVADRDAYYQWQRCSNAILENDVYISPTESTWDSVAGRTEDYTVAVPGLYRRAYITKCGTEYSNAISVTSAGSYVPGIEIGGSEEVCSGSEVILTIGGTSDRIEQSNGSWWITLPGATTPTSIAFQWQMSENNIDWTNISGATNFNYTISGTFTNDMYYRRLITNIGGCELADLDMGVFRLIVRPVFEYTQAVVPGCNGSNDARVSFSITGGSGSYSVYRDIDGSRVDANINNGRYEFVGLSNTGTTPNTYQFTITDNIYHCSKTVDVTINSPAQILINDVEPIEGCQGAVIDIPIPTIEGGTYPYIITLDLGGLGMGTNEPLSSAHCTLPDNIGIGTKTIQYRVQDASNCYASKSQSVLTVNPMPKIELATTNVTNCSISNGTITTNITNTGTTAPYNYELSYMLNNTTQNNVVSDNSTTHIFEGLEQINYNVKVTDAKGCSSVQKTATISDGSSITITMDVLDTEGNSIRNGEFYTTCPNKPITLKVLTITDGENTYVLDDETIYSQYQYSFTTQENEYNYGDANTYTVISRGVCGPQTFYVRVKNTQTYCTHEQVIMIYIEDSEVPTINGNITETKETYFCNPFQLDLDAALRSSILDITQDNCASDEELVLSLENTIGEAIVSKSYGYTRDASGNTIPVDIPVYVKDRCGRTSVCTVKVTPTPWPEFKVKGTEAGLLQNTNCYCYANDVTLKAVLADNTEITETTYPGASYQWYKVSGETNTLLADGDKYIGANTTELVIKSVGATDGGIYRLVVTGGSGSNICSLSKEITICVYPAIEFRLE